MRQTSEKVFDKRCVRYTVALAGVWCMYKRGMWEQLRQVGIHRTQVEGIFREFEGEQVFNARGLIRSPAQALEFSKLHPSIVSGAARLAGLYTMLYGMDNPELEREQAHGRPVKPVLYYRERHAQ